MPSLCTLLAYGEFRSTDFLGMLAETLPHFLRWTIPPFLLYAISSVVCELPRGRWIGPSIYFLGLLLSLPFMGVMGAWGPAHVAMHAGEPAWLAFLLLLIVKAILTPSGPRPAHGRPCPRCGYDLCATRSGICSECGTACSPAADANPDGSIAADSVL